ncbi:Parvovirus coat protein VP1-like protein [Pradoshia sp.]
MMRNRRRKRGFCVPGYRYCGPGCSGPGSPTNAVDSCCKRHDDCYQRYGPCKYCDDLFLDCLRPKINRQTNMGRDAALFYNVMRLRSSFR